MIFDELWWAERRQERELKKVRGVYYSLLAQARQEENLAQCDSLMTEIAVQSDFIRDEVESLRTRRLLRRARNLGLPVPPCSDEDFWECNSQTGSYYLTDNGRSEFCRSIQRANRERYDEWARWALLAIGLLGMVTGFLSVLHRCN